MDATLLDQVRTILAPALPYLLELGGCAAEGTAKKIGADTWDAARKLWGKLRPAVEQKEVAKEAAVELAQEPDDPDVQASFRRQLRKLLEADDALAAEVRDLLGGTSIRIAIQGDGATAQVVDARSVTVIRAETVNYMVERIGGRLAEAAPGPDLTEATRRYLQFLLDRYSFLELRGMGVTDRVPLQLSLLDMYVPLKARIEMPEGDTWSRNQLKLAGRRPSDEEQEAMGRSLGQPQPVLELLQNRDGLIVLGDPGSGKTTLLKYLALSLAAGRAAELGLDFRLPVLLPLSAYATALAEADQALPEFIARYAEERGVNLALGPLLSQALESGGALILLDGLDEVSDPRQRRVVVDRVMDFFAIHRRTGNRFILTSRIVGYREVRPEAEGLAECTLVDFGEEEIEAFVEHWTVALERAAGGDTVVARRQAEEEKDELLGTMQRNPAVRELAANPLLLTILALMKRQGMALPEHRVELYQKYVETLVRTWNLSRGLDARAGREVDLRETLRVLAPVALWMHETDPGRGLVSEHALLQRLAQIFGERGVDDSEAAAERFLTDLRHGTGLLLDRGGRQFGFIHLTFQEYLAAVAVAQLGQQSVEPVVQVLAAHLDDPSWHEVVLLCVGYLGLVQQRDQAAGEVLLEMFREGGARHGQAVVLAGEAVADVWPGGVTDGCRTEVIDALLAVMRDDANIEPVQRAAAGRALARVGDPRPEVMTVDGMQLCWVPAGPFWMGAAEDDEEALDREKPGHELDIPYGYWIGRYPVTVAQFAEFVAASGFEPGHRDALQGRPNEPVVWINRDEALAFCRWLGERWQAAGWLGSGRRVVLPSEAEWEKAARGGFEVLPSAMIRSADSGLVHAAEEVARAKNQLSRRIYPWGSDHDSNLANVGETDIDVTSAVGCFAAGASPYGCEEMSGNVWEWSRSLWGKEWKEPDFPYPYNPEDGRESIDSSSLPVLRAGSFDYYRILARCSFRSRDYPDDRYSDVGFRVAVPPFPLSSGASDL